MWDEFDVCGGADAGRLAGYVGYCAWDCGSRGLRVGLVAGEGDVVRLWDSLDSELCEEWEWWDSKTSFGGY